MSYLWDGRFIALAEHIASWSKDPSTQTGCVLARPADHAVVSVGYNGPARGVDDDRILDSRETRLALTVHAEINACLLARRDVRGCHAYIWPWPPCAPCAGALVQAGIARVIAPEPTAAQRERWADSFTLMEAILSDAQVPLEVAT